ncbi:MAG: hypothetical protein KKE16_03050 [Firmicutes bacterium]|nr:hypothetical protein [Bacillota bacterium]
MKKTILCVLSLLFVFITIGCAKTTQFEVGSNENIQDKIHRVMSAFEESVEYFISGQADDEIHVLESEDNIYQPEDYMSTYNSMDMQDQVMSANYRLYEHYQYVSRIVEMLDFSLPRNLTTFTCYLNLQTSEPTEPFEVYIKDFEIDYILMEFIVPYSFPYTIVIGFDEEEKLDIYVRIQSENSSNLSLSVFHFNEDKESTDYHRYLDGTESITKTNYQTKEKYSYSTHDFNSVVYYPDWNQLEYQFYEDSWELDFISERGQYFSYQVTEVGVTIGWQILESTGWDYVQASNMGLEQNAGDGIYVGELNIYHPETDTLINVLRPEDGIVSVYLIKNFNPSEVTDSIIDLSTYGLTLSNTELTLSYIEQTKAEQQAIVEELEVRYSGENIVSAFNYIFEKYLD